MREAQGPQPRHRELCYLWPLARKTQRVTVPRRALVAASLTTANPRRTRELRPLGPGYGVGLPDRHAPRGRIVDPKGFVYIARSQPPRTAASSSRSKVERERRPVIEWSPRSHRELDSSVPRAIPLYSYINPSVIIPTMWYVISHRSALCYRRTIYPQRTLVV